MCSVSYVFSTVPAFNSCTKCAGMSPDIINDHTPDCHPVSWAWMEPQVPDLQLNVASICKLCWSSMCLAYFFGTFIHQCLYDHTLAEVWSTGAGIKCLYCTGVNPFAYGVHNCDTLGMEGISGSDHEYNIGY